MDSHNSSVQAVNDAEERTVEEDRQLAHAEEQKERATKMEAFATLAAFGRHGARARSRYPLL